MARTPDDPLRDTVDDAIGRGLEALPESALKRTLKQAGWIGLVLGFLIGNVPLSALTSAFMSRSATVNLDAFETYWTVLVLFTPFVVLFGVAVALIESGNLPQAPGAIYIGAAVLLWWAATIVSFWLGGLVPASALAGPVDLSPSGGLAYITSAIGEYVDFYGAVPVIAGPVEGAAFGYWAALMFRSA